ncbi:MAG: hypothetical protein WC686_03600 [Candidatus Shapirobacteria bacterium]|jgi:hypothetical protein
MAGSSVEKKEQRRCVLAPEGFGHPSRQSLIVDIGENGLCGHDTGVTVDCQQEGFDHQTLAVCVSQREAGTCPRRLTL